MMSLKSRRIISCVALVALMATISVRGYGQTQTTGSIGGVVQDQTSAFIPGVEVTAEQQGTGLKRSTVSDETGAFTLALLPAGQYSVTFALPGFRKVINRNVSVNATEKITLNGKLQIADIDTTVEVSAAAQLMQTETTTLGRVIDERVTTALPLPTKNYTQLLGLSTGTSAAIPDTAAVGRGSVNISANGAATDSNAFLLDGVDANNIHTNQASENSLASNGVPVPSTETIREFKVQSGLYDAQYGRNAGSNINVVTKSGTNEVHVTLYYYFRNEVLNANNFFFNRTGTKRPILRQNQYGATVGGPIVRDHTFFFLGFQGTRQLNGASSSRSIRSLVLPPIPAVRTRATLAQVFAGQAGLRGGVAIARDGSNINPVALSLLNARLPNGDFLIPSPQTTDAGVNYSVSIPARYEEEQVTLNLDHDFTPKHRTSLRLFGANTPQTVGLSGDVPGFPLMQDFKNRNLSLTYTYTITPRIVNEARTGFSRPAGITLFSIPVTAEQIGLNRFNRDVIREAPTISVSGLFTIGYSANVPQMTIPNVFTYQDTLSLSRGTHFIRTGVEVRRHQSNIYNNWNWRGTINFLSFPDFLLGMQAGPAGNGSTVSNVQQSTILAGQTYRNYRATDMVGFIQDDWKATTKLNLNLGVRYDFLGPMSDKSGRMGNFDPRKYEAPPPGGQTSTGFVIPRNTKFPVPGVPLVNNYLIDHSERMNFAPRLGLAYRPFANKSFVIRAGYGIFFDRVSNQLVLDTITSLPFSTLYRESGVDNAFASFENPFPVLPRNEMHPVVPVIYAPPYTADRRPVSVFSVSPDVSTPYLQHYSLNVQHELARNLLLEVGYVGSKGTKLYGTPTVNQPLLASPEHPVNGITTNTAANASQRVPWFGLSATGVNQAQTDSDSRYNSLQMSLTKRMSSGLQFLGSYTWAKSLDNNSGGDQSDAKLNRGPSSFDRSHRFVYSYLYEIPAWGFGLNNSKFGSKFFSGWQITGVATVQTGSAFSITDSTGARLFGSTSSRASYAPGATLETAKLSGSVTDRLNRYFNTAAFVPAGDLWGDTGRNILRGPGQKNIDLALIKRTRFMENRSVEWRMEVFNVTNTPNFANPSGNLNSSAFGTISSSVANARLVQFGLRILN